MNRRELLGSLVLSPIGLYTNITKLYPTHSISKAFISGFYQRLDTNPGKKELTKIVDYNGYNSETKLWDRKITQYVFNNESLHREGRMGFYGWVVFEIPQYIRDAREKYDSQNRELAETNFGDYYNNIPYGNFHETVFYSIEYELPHFLQLIGDPRNCISKEEHKEIGNKYAKTIDSDLKNSLKDRGYL